MVNRSIRWSVTAFKQFESAILYISRDSVRNAEQVRLDILESVDLEQIRILRVRHTSREPQGY
jgi:plasmid stabilization system protein ParE